LAAVLLASGPLRAADWGAVAAVTSEYVFRGVSLTDGDPAVQAGLHVRLPQRWYASAWASSLKRSPRSGRAELNLHAGRGWDLSENWAASAGWVRYLYPDSARSGRYDWDELSASVIYTDRLALTASLSPNAPQAYALGLGERHRATAIEASWRQPVAGPWSVVAAAGRYSAGSFGRPYVAWNAGLSLKMGGIDVGLTRFGVDGAGRARFGQAAADGRWVVTFAWRYASR
jgi:uncharacterized protein (TIGR02001 family)